MIKQQWHHSERNGKYNQQRMSPRERSEAETSVSSADESEEMMAIMQDDNQEDEARFAQFLDSDEELDSEEIDSDQQDGKEEEIDKDPTTTIDFSGRKEDHELLLRKQMEHIPFSTLAKAKTAMRREKELGDDEDDVVYSGSEINQFETDRNLMNERQDEREYQLIEKRQSKHA